MKKLAILLACLLAFGLFGASAQTLRITHKEQVAIDAINQWRTAQGLSGLVPNVALMEAARDWAEYISHTGIQDADCRTYALERGFVSSTPDVSSVSCISAGDGLKNGIWAVAIFAGSEPHAKIMRLPYWNQVGVGTRAGNWVFFFGT